MITLKTLPQASAQEVFDQVARHMLTQKQQSMKNDVCAYRGEGGLMCAAGCLIADDEYNPEFDGQDHDTDWFTIVELYDEVPDDHFELIRRLQQVHDKSTDHKDWVYDLYQCAKEFGLSKNVVDEMQQ